MRHVLTVDLEDWFHVCGAERRLPPERWDELPSRLPETTRRMLDLFDEHDARATFFVLGYVARRHPDLVADIADRGHEIGSHGYSHQRVYDLTPHEFATDLRASVAAIRDACGVEPRSFRAPEWSIRPSCDWAFPVLAEHGFSVDSSVVPLTWLGSLTFPHRPYVVKTPSGPITEIPLSTIRTFHERLPYSGGLPFRLLPEWYFFRIFGREQARGRPCILYLHPSDLQDELPAADLPANRQLVQRFRRRCVAPRLLRTLEAFRFHSMRESLESENEPHAVTLPPEIRRAVRRSFAASAPWWFGVAPLAAFGVGAALGPPALLIPPGVAIAGYVYHAYRVAVSRRQRRRSVADRMHVPGVPGDLLPAGVPDDPHTT